MKGIILDKGFDYFTYMDKVITPIKEYFIQYNWLITDCECYHEPFYSNEKDYTWISGKDFLEIVNKESMQFIWAVFSGFSNNLTLDDVLKYKLPNADGYTDFWKNPISIQHPLSEIEIVPWDSSFMLLISKNDEVVNKFVKAFPLSKDLETYNAEV